MSNKKIKEMYEILTKQWGDSDNLINDLLNYSKKLQQENKELKDNWTKLKEYMKDILVYGEKPKMEIKSYSHSSYDEPVVV